MRSEAMIVSQASTFRRSRGLWHTPARPRTRCSPSRRSEGRPAPPRIRQRSNTRRLNPITTPAFGLASVRPTIGITVKV